MSRNTRKDKYASNSKKSSATNAANFTSDDREKLHEIGETRVILDTGLPRTRHFRFDFLATTCHTVIFEHSSMSCNLFRTWNTTARQSNF